MDLYREIELNDPAVVRKELEKVIKISVFSKRSDVERTDKLILLDKWKVDLTEMYSTEELTLMYKTLEKEEKRDSVILTKTTGTIALTIAIIALIMDAFIVDGNDGFLFFTVIITKIMAMIVIYIAMFNSFRINNLEQKQEESRRVYLPVIKAALNLNSEGGNWYAVATFFIYPILKKQLAYVRW